MHGSAAQNKMSKSETAAAISAGAAEVAEQARQAPEKKQYRLPPLSLLNRVKREENRSQRFELAARAQKLETVLHDFGVAVDWAFRSQPGEKTITVVWEKEERGHELL